MDYSSIIMLLAIVVVFYFFIIRPENKRKKQAEEMRSHLSKGDQITTIGGLVGKVVATTEKTVVIETSEDRVRIELTKWAVSSNNTAEAAAEEEKKKKEEARKEARQNKKAELSAKAEKAEKDLEK